METNYVSPISWVTLLFILCSSHGCSQNLRLSFTGVWTAQKDLMLTLHLEKTAFIFGYPSGGTRRPVPRKYVVAQYMAADKPMRLS